MAEWEATTCPAASTAERGKLGAAHGRPASTHCNRLPAMEIEWRIRSIGTPALPGRMISLVDRHALQRKTCMSRKQQNAAHNEDAQTAARRINRREQSLDEALEASFPASDPPAVLAPHSSER